MGDGGWVAGGGWVGDGECMVKRIFDGYERLLVGKCKREKKAYRQVENVVT